MGDDGDDKTERDDAAVIAGLKPGETAGELKAEYDGSMRGDVC